MFWPREETTARTGRVAGVCGPILGLFITVVGSPAAVGRAEDPPPSVAQPPLPTTPPQITFASPGYVSKCVTEVQTISVQFHVPVRGVRAEDLAVNGAPAGRVESRDGRWYTFRGFAPPRLGEVRVSVAPGRIGRDPDGLAFEGFAWTFRLVDPAADDDGDGMRNSEEIAAYTDPTRADTDEDGLPDSFEVHHPCLNPISDEAHPMSYGAIPLPGDDDADDDGRSDLQEFQHGTDPCMRDDKHKADAP